MQIHWVKYQNGHWYRLNDLDLNSGYFNNIAGVYVIRCAGNNQPTLKVGQGVIRNRLRVHCQDRAIQNFNHLGLYVTWASIWELFRDGVETFLAQQLRPLLGERYPDVFPIAVNLPW